MESEEETALLTQALDLLVQRFPDVQILASRVCPAEEGGGTVIRQRGRGNFYARQGMARTFLDHELAREHAHAIKHTLSKRHEITPDILPQVPDEPNN